MNTLVTYLSEFALIWKILARVTVRDGRNHNPVT
jgi:hypothetical protein